ncbi:MAG: hypothetical protein ACLQEG_11075 [Acidimicrobiales bacterium]
MTDFQASAGIQGRQFAEQCSQLLTHYGYTLHGRALIGNVGVEIDCVATSPAGNAIWFELKGSVQGTRPGLLRTDTLKKAIANGALLAGQPTRCLFIVLTSHLPVVGAGAAMLETALRLKYLDDVICLYSPEDTRRLRVL